MKRYTIEATVLTPGAVLKLNKDGIAQIIHEDSQGEWVKYEDVAKKFGEHGELCDCCKRVGNDRRTLLMACGAEMEELNIPFSKFKVDSGIPGFNRDELYTLHVCKSCRSKWMDAIKEWFENGGDNDC